MKFQKEDKNFSNKTKPNKILKNCFKKVNCKQILLNAMDGVHTLFINCGCQKKFNH